MSKACFTLVAGILLLFAAVRPASAQEEKPGPTAPPPAAGSVLASEETDWPGIVVELTEFRRKGNTLTARVRLKNGGSETPRPEIVYREAYLLDTGAGKKYEALKDEKGNYIAALHSGYSDKWFDEIAPGQQRMIWIKFPAPPPDVKSVTLQIPGAPPLEDVPIQDS
jgi:hypothetical protein